MSVTPRQCEMKDVLDECDTQMILSYLRDVLDESDTQTILSYLRDVLDECDTLTMRDEGCT